MNSHFNEINVNILVIIDQNKLSAYDLKGDQLYKIKIKGEEIYEYSVLEEPISYLNEYLKVTKNQQSINLFIFTNTISDEMCSTIENSFSNSHLFYFPLRLLNDISNNVGTNNSSNNYEKLENINTLLNEKNKTLENEIGIQRKTLEEKQIILESSQRKLLLQAGELSELKEKIKNFEEGLKIEIIYFNEKNLKFVETMDKNDKYIYEENIEISKDIESGTKINLGDKIGYSYVSKTIYELLINIDIEGYFYWLIPQNKKRIRLSELNHRNHLKQYAIGIVSENKLKKIESIDTFILSKDIDF